MTTFSLTFQSVYKCDFLSLETHEPLQVAPDTEKSFLNTLHSPIETLPKDLFHVVVFSLLLEYFPSPYQVCFKTRLCGLPNAHFSKIEIQILMRRVQMNLSM